MQHHAQSVEGESYDLEFYSINYSTNKGVGLNIPFHLELCYSTRGEFSFLGP